MLETGGQLSVLLRADCQPATPQQMKLPVKDDVHLPLVIVSDGHLLTKNMEKLQLDETWLHKQLKLHAIQDYKGVFLLTVDSQGTVEVTKKEAEK